MVVIVYASMLSGWLFCMYICCNMVVVYVYMHDAFTIMYDALTISYGVSRIFF